MCCLVDLGLFTADGIFPHFEFPAFSIPEHTACSLRHRSVFVDVDVVALESGKQAVNLRRCVRLARQDVVHLVIKDITAFLAQVDEAANPLILFLKHKRQRLLP